jgi:hypothetical protein
LGERDPEELDEPNILLFVEREEGKDDYPEPAEILSRQKKHPFLFMMEPSTIPTHYIPDGSLKVPIMDGLTS